MGLGLVENDFDLHLVKQEIRKVFIRLALSVGLKAVISSYKTATRELGASV